MIDLHAAIVDPLAAKWGRESLLVLTRPGQGGNHGSVLMRPDYCRNKACHCAEVEFEISRIDEPLADVGEADVRIRRLLEDQPVEPEATTIVLELQIGKFSWIGVSNASNASPHDESEREQILQRSEGVSDEVVAWAHALEQCIDGEILDELWDRHLLARGRDPKQLLRRPPDNYEIGTLDWHDVCPTARRDVFFDADTDTMMVAHDSYCPKPTCTCVEAHVSFATAEGSIGTVTVSFETDDLRILPQEGWSSDELQAAWTRYVERWPDYRGRLRERYHRLRATLHNAMLRKFGAITTSVIPRRNGTKVGRNEPCPCGSGRKYKRCCGGGNLEST